jgi:integrase
MNVVQPIRDKRKLEEVKAWFSRRPPRDNLLFLVGINTGLRISDILRLRMRDIDGQHIVLREKKTGKRRFIPVNEELAPIFRQYCKGRHGSEFLFSSREGINQPITTSMAYRLMREAAAAVGLKHIGTHTLRKTFGYHLYQQTRDPQLVCQALDHSDPAITERYIGINQDTLDTAIRKFRI